MEIINDANGYIYTAVTEFLMGAASALVNNGHTMTIKCLTGDPKYKGAVITFRNVFLEKVDGMQFGYSNNEISKFSVSFNYLDFTFTPGALGKAAGVLGGIDKLIS